MDYTKGPWRADIRIGCVAVYSGNKVNCIEESEGKRLYYAHGYKDSNDVWQVEPEKIANAHLIAAAPDMYELLKDIEQNSRRCPVCKCLKENGHDYTCRLAQVLAKVESREG